jgi:hypothetical protein
MTSEELIGIKQRLLIGAAAAKRIALAPDRFVFFDQEAYLTTLRCLAAMTDDVAAVLAELDVLRAAAGSEVVFPWDIQKEETNGDAGHGEEPVGQGEGDAGGGRGEAARHEPAGTGGAVPDKRAPRKRARRSKSSGNKVADGTDSAAVEQGDRAASVDRGEEQG